MFGERLGRRDISDIDGPVGDATPERTDSGGGFIRFRVIVQMAERDVRALPREQQSGRSADTARSAGYQGDLVP
jgi:hypothetical protein